MSTVELNSKPDEEIRLVEVVDKKNNKSILALSCKCGNIDQKLFKYVLRREMLKIGKGSKFKYFYVPTMFCKKDRCNNSVTRKDLDRQYRDINHTMESIKQSQTDEQPPINKDN